jgi:hypothetical protein
MKRILLTYQHEHEPIVNQLTRILKHPDLELITNNTLVAGDTLDKTTEREVASADAIIVFLSKPEGQSEWLDSKVSRYITSTNKLIVPVLFEGYQENLLFSVLGDKECLVFDELGIEGIASKIHRFLNIFSQFNYITIEGPDGQRFAVEDVSSSLLIKDVARGVMHQYPSIWPKRDGKSNNAVVDRITKENKGERLDPKISLQEARIRPGDTLRVRSERTAGCFPRDTNILLNDFSTKPINELVPGDEIAVTTKYFDQRNSAVIKEVVCLNSRRCMVINDRLRVTPTHPILINKEWRNAGDLRLGDTLFQPDETVLHVQNLAIESFEREVYNLILNSQEGGFFAEKILVKNTTNLESMSALDILKKLQNKGLLREDMVVTFREALLSLGKLQSS